MFDDENFLGLKDEQERIAEQQIQTTNFKKLTGETDDKTHHVEQAFQPKPPPDYKPPPNSQPPNNPPKFDKGTQSRPDTMAAAVQTNGKPPPPPGSGAIKMNSSTQTHAPQVFDIGIDDSMDDDNDDFKKFLVEQEQTQARRQTDIREQIKNILDLIAQQQTNHMFQD